MKKCGFLALAAAGTLIGCSSAPQPTVEPAAAEAAPQAVEAAAKKDTLATQADRYSYALGQNIGQSVKDIFALGLSVDLVGKGIHSAIDSTVPPLMTKEEVDATLQELVAELQKKREADAKAAAEKSVADQKAFLEKNKTAEGVITTASGLQYKITQNAEGITPKKDDRVKVHYKGTLLDGKQFDSSYDRGEPLEFPVTAVIEGWQELLLNLKAGMKATAWIPSELAYGEAGAPPIIPGNSMLIFEVELIEVVQANPTPADTLAVPAADSTAKPAEAAPAEAPKAEAPKADVKPEAKAAEPAKQDAKPAAKQEAAKPEAKPVEATKSDSKK